MLDETTFRVIIVGGGVSGLTLANCLEKAKIDYVLLERRDEIAPQVGASIGLMPNGIRILDQLGCYDDLTPKLSMIHGAADRDFEGNLFHVKNETLYLLKTRSGYPAAFGDRQALLQVLYEKIVDKSKVILNKDILSIQDNSEGVKVFCKDGSCYDGDVVAGCDGIYSKVRDEMWRLADAAEPGLISEKEKQSMLVNFKCLYGICSPVPGFEVDGVVNVNYTKDKMIMIIGGVEKLYVFLVEKLDQIRYSSDLPRYNDKDTEAFAASFAHYQVTPDIKFGTVWENKRTHKLVTMEEADFQIWNHGRIACVGDSIQKMTANCAQGGNSSIESAAALTNALKKMIDTTSERPSKSQVSGALQSYRQLRKHRMAAIVSTCNQLTHVQTMSNWFNRLFISQLQHRLGDSLIDMQSDLMIGAVSLDFLPAPKRSLEGGMPFNPLQGEGFKESKLKRAFLATPFLLLWYLSHFHIMEVTPALPLVIERLQLGKTEWSNGSVPLLTSFYGVKWLDNLWIGIVPFFTSTIYGIDPEARWQTISFLIDIAPILAIVYIESTRRANAMKPSQLPVVLGIFAQFYGIGASIHLYLFAAWILTPISVFRATDLRLTNLAYTSSILPALIIGYYIPTFVQFLHPSLEARQQWNWIWQMFPIWVSTITYALSKLRKNTIDQDKFFAPKRDLNTIRYTLGTTITISALTWWTVLTQTPFPMSQLFIPTTAPDSSSTLEVWIRGFLKWDEVFMFASVGLWLGYSFWDIKAAGMIKTSWASILFMAGLTTLTLGPGAAAGLGWIWRDEVVTGRRHWAAVTRTGAEEGEAGEVKRRRKDSGIGSGVGEKVAL